MPAGIRCKDCALRRNRLFRPLGKHEIASIDLTKRSHLTLPAGAEIIRQDGRSRFAYTLFDGWALRSHQHRQGSRQVLDILLPGDTIGLAAVMLGASVPSVSALTSVSLCVLDGKRMTALLESCPGLTLAILKTRLDDERRVDARLVMLGQMRAAERVGYLLIETYHRLRLRGLANNGTCPFPLRRLDLADAVGLSQVHVMRALGALRSESLAHLDGRDLHIPNVGKLARYAGFASTSVEERRVIV
jgi:CRP/FNR family transcriptional regulator